MLTRGAALSQYRDVRRPVSAGPYSRTRPISELRSVSWPVPRSWPENTCYAMLVGEFLNGVEAVGATVVIRQEFVRE